MSETLRINGQEIAAERLDVVQANEQWSEYLLGDGTVIRAKHVLKHCLKAVLPGGGEPLYFLVHEPVNDVRLVPPSQPGRG